MATGIFRTLPESTVLNRRDLYLEALDDLSTGSKATSMSLGGKSYTFTPADTTRLMGLIDECNWALQHANPTDYGKRVTKTYADFSGIEISSK